MHIHLNEILGDTGNKLFLITFVDTDDSEDTHSQIWRANDEDHMKSQLKEELCGPEADWNDNLLPEDPEAPDNAYWPGIADKFEEDWGFSILCEEIGEITEKIVD